MAKTKKQEWTLPPLHIHKHRYHLSALAILSSVFLIIGVEYAPFLMRSEQLIAQHGTYTISELYRLLEGPARALFVTSFSFHGFFLLLYAYVGIQKTHHSHQGVRLQFFLVGMYALCGFALFFLPLNAPGTPMTFQSAMHWSVATVLFASAVIAILLSSVHAHTGRIHTHSLFILYSRLSLAAMVVVFIGMLIIAQLDLPYFGFAERMAISVSMMWMTLLPHGFHRAGKPLI